MRQIAVASVSIAVALFGCLLGSPSEICYDAMAARLSYQGFSFKRPPNRNWFIRRSEENFTDVTLRRELSDPGTAHSFYASVSLGDISKDPESHEEFAELARLTAQEASHEARRVSYTQSLATRQNQWCIRLESVDVEGGVPGAADEDLTVLVRGYRCLHPTWPKVTLDCFYSERGLSRELDQNLSDEGEAFLEGVQIDVAPGTPAAYFGRS